MSEDLDVLFPQGKKLMAAGEEITILPFTFGQLPKAMKLMLPVVDSLKSSGILKTDEGNLTIANDWMLRLPEIMVEGGEPLMQLCAFSSGKSRDWLDSVQSDEGIAIAMSIFEVNADFFRKRVAPMMGLSVTANHSTGSTLSTSSSEPVTEEPTLTVTP
jgi:hypothetical protein